MKDPEYIPIDSDDEQDVTDGPVTNESPVTGQIRPHPGAHLHSPSHPLHAADPASSPMSSQSPKKSLPKKQKMLESDDEQQALSPSELEAALDPDASAPHSSRSEPHSPIPNPLPKKNSVLMPAFTTMAHAPTAELESSPASSSSPHKPPAKKAKPLAPTVASSSSHAGGSAEPVPVRRGRHLGMRRPYNFSHLAKATPAPSQEEEDEDEEDDAEHKDSERWSDE
ncbi:hypothetical protein C8F01DRAFT_1117395 [Mycena amicta]|nr:hypothetical protein C8F01DRAFT_1117395 [Mycena amicta]